MSTTPFRSNARRTTMIDTIRSAIKEFYHLNRDGRQWFIQEDRKLVTLRSPDKNCFGFSLDKTDHPGLAFFSPAPPKGVAKVCDGMIAVLHNQKLYLFSVEVKSRHKGDARKQLVNGQLFWRWLIHLCKRHHHLSQSTDVCYISLLIWSPRERSPRKGTTTHLEDSEWKKRTVDKFKACFEVPNREDIALVDLIEMIAKGN